MPIGLATINGTVLWTGNTTGPAPLAISWSISISSGGIPPYQSDVEFEPYIGGNFSWNSTNLNGTENLTSPGMYLAIAVVADSTCDAMGGAILGPITVYNATVGDPVQITASTSGGSVPLGVTYTENTTNVPYGYTMLWQRPYSNQSSGWSINTTYYVGGNESAVGCLINETTGVWLACGNSSTVVASGSDLATAVAVGNGTRPVNITFWLNVTTPSALPRGWTVDLWTDNGTLVQNSSQNVSTSVTAAFGCGASNPTNPPNAAGTCVWTASYLLTASGAYGPRYVAQGTIWTNLTANGTPASWYPTVVFTEAPTNASTPVNVSVNLTASNGLAPYDYWWAVFGASSAASNQTFFRTVSGNGTAWNGSALTLVFPFHHSGVYMITVTVRDANLNYVFLYPPVLALGVPLAPRPLHLSASGSTVGSTGPNESLVDFVALVSGGIAPYTIQWTFGDGAYGASLSGATVQHSFEGAGSYTPTVTATDSRGSTVVVALPAVVVTPPPARSPGTPQPNSTAATPGAGFGLSPIHLSTIGPTWAALGLAAAVLALVVSIRLIQRRSAERLLRGLEDDARGRGADVPDAP
jgi:hypothetical protein